MQHVYPFLPSVLTRRCSEKCPRALLFKRTKDKLLTSCNTVNEDATTVLELWFEERWRMLCKI